MSETRNENESEAQDPERILTDDELIKLVMQTYPNLSREKAVQFLHDFGGL